jgi:phosphoribosylformimino-5-aminoimidazole carboxamide ribonucleotide (ProFAR) isomerase
MRKEITMVDLIKWIDRRIERENRKRELPHNKEDLIQLGGKIRAYKEIKSLIKAKWIEV